MLVSILLILGGLVLLGFGGEFLIRGASALALRLRLTPTVIGLTVVALGTSLPELVVSLAAQFQGSTDMAVGNVIGSNLFNIGLVLGLGSLIRPLTIAGSTVRLEWPFMLTSSCLAILFARDSLTSETSVIDRLEGGFFVIALALFTAYMVRLARREVGASESAALNEEVQDLVGKDPDRAPLTKPVLLVVGGMIGLALGGDLTVRGATQIAESFGVSDRIIGLTILAAGTGLPELVATLIAVAHRRTDMAVGNIVGSNIFNVLGILGTTAIVSPLPVSAETIHWDLWWMLGLSVVLGPLLLGRSLNRFEGALLVAIYIAYGVGLAWRTSG